MLNRLAFLLPLLVVSAASAQSKLQVRVLTASPEGFLVNSTLVTGEKDAVLIDAAFTQADAHRLVAAVLESKKNLTHIYVTHGHPDHYFGAAVLLQAFPKARLVALPATVAEIQKTWKPKLAQWKPMYGANLTDKPAFPEPLKGQSLSLEGEALELQGPVQGDDGKNSFVWIPSLKTVVAGDIVYSGVHPWTAETKADSRKAWSATVEKLAALAPAQVIAGHQKPELKPETSSLQFVKAYLATFDDAVAKSKTSEEVQSKVKAKYPDLALDVILKLGADAAVSTPKG
ncbi:MAG: MBL fold metallo-hydrolase [Myxococcaceae bacterium]